MSCVLLRVTARYPLEFPLTNSYSMQAMRPEIEAINMEMRNVSRFISSVQVAFYMVTCFKHVRYIHHNGINSNILRSYFY